MTKTLTEEAQAVHLEVMQLSNKLLSTKPEQEALEAAFSLAPMAVVLQQVLEAAAEESKIEEPQVLQLATYLIGEFANSEIEVVSQSDVEKDPLGIAKRTQQKTEEYVEVLTAYEPELAMEHTAFAGVAQSLISYYKALRKAHGDNKVELVGNLSVALGVLFTNDEIEQLVEEIKEIES